MVFIFVYLYIVDTKNSIHTGAIYMTPNPKDVVFTPRNISKAVIEYLKPTGEVLEPCRGDGSFYDTGVYTDWCEISQGRDFLQYNKKVDWIITNPPFSIYDNFLIKSMEISDNIAFLIPLNKAIRGIKMHKLITEYGGLHEIIHLGTGSRCGFPFGFPVGVCVYKRGYKGDIKYTDWTEMDWLGKNSNNN